MKTLPTLPPFIPFVADTLGLDVTTRLPMLTFLMAVHGERLNDVQRALFEKYTQRPCPPG